MITKTRVSNPILHDIVKSFLVRDAQNILSFCSTLPQLKRSRIFLPESPHIFNDSREEWFYNGIHYPHDAVWHFIAPSHPSLGNPSYVIIHEIKTGSYDIHKEMDKHYIHHNHVQLYIWAYKDAHKENERIPYSYVKQLDINLLRKYISSNTIRLMEDWRDA
jgi:hypothetical protein